MCSRSSPAFWSSCSMWSSCSSITIKWQHAGVTTFRLACVMTCPDSWRNSFRRPTVISVHRHWWPVVWLCSSRSAFPSSACRLPFSWVYSSGLLNMVPLSSDRGHHPLPTSGWAEGTGAGRQLSRGAGSCPARFRSGATHSGNRAGVTFPGQSHGAFLRPSSCCPFSVWGKLLGFLGLILALPAHLPWPDLLSPLSLEIRNGGRTLGDQGIEEPVVQKKATMNSFV